MCTGKISIKNAERGSHSAGQIQFNFIIGSTKITQWGTFLSNNKNKLQLIRLLVSRRKRQCSATRESKIYVSFNEKCVCIQSNGLCGPAQALGCNHEEADTRILLHANHICQSTENVVIYTPDTDVLLIAIAASGQIPGSLFIRTGTKYKACIISIYKVKQSLILRDDLQNIDIQLFLKSLISFHALTGCDTTSSFSGKGKKMSFKVMLNNQSYIEESAAFGDVPTVSDEQTEWVQAFVSDVYGHKGKNINPLRY